ncbi:glycoside hydrolase family 55 protein [Sphingomonas sp. S1-29]|uniref:glycosyl hydrolase family 28-related protein n=1 Tax=Sphingomonas sp. S1-29 TaxID=2991074 RepID=UPI002240369F|nr:glycosyl hydrolase family 28-related protein [Sphingomonas sp. S1-29]UZK69592.1 glycoside hydrolase family 55 protein [Sphingomonas sp. S1-29]
MKSINTPRYGNIYANADTFAELRSIPANKIQPGCSAIVSGGLVRGDGLGGLYYWDAISTAEDDADTVLTPDKALAAGRWIKIGLAEPGPQGPQGTQGEGLSSVMSPTGATLVGYQGRTVARKLAETVSVKDFGAVGNGIADDTAAIQAAIDASQDGVASVLFPTGTYKVSATGLHPWAGGNDMKVALFLRSGLELVGQRGTTIMMAPDLSSDAAPIGMALMFTNTALENISIRNLRFDMNGANNKHAHSLSNHAHLHVSGNAAYIDNVDIHDCEFINTAGVSCIVMGQCGPPPEGVNIPLGSGWNIARCKFINNGTDTVDHSSIFAWAEDVVISECLFDSPPYIPEVGNGNACSVELHGANQRLINNTFRGGAYQAVWVSENTTRESRNLIIDSNTFLDILAFGICFFGQGEQDYLKPARSTKISNNQFEFSNIPYPGVDVKGGVTIASPYGQEEWEVTNNTFRIAEGMTTANAGVLVIGGLEGQKHDKGLIEGNTSYGCSYCVALFTYDAGEIGTVMIRNNTAFDSNGAGVLSNGSGILVSGGSAIFHDLTIENNHTIDTQSPPTAFWGLRMSGTVTRLSEKFNRAYGVIVAPSDYTGLSVGFRYGFNSVPEVMGGTTIDTEARAAIEAIRISLVQAGMLPE